jgi:glyoxylase-like metal-dependent hydrolase (beta-lactamase superfamily II)
MTPARVAPRRAPGPRLSPVGERPSPQVETVSTVFDSGVTSGWICATCGVARPNRLAVCPICADARQWVPTDGTRWTTEAELAPHHQSRLVEEEPGLLGIGIEPPVAIGQRALLVTTPAGNVLFDCIPFLDAAARQALDVRGGIAAICPSHPHFYGALAQFATLFHAPVHIPEADAHWLPPGVPSVHLFSGDEVEPVPGVRLLRLGGHFPGSTVLLWPEGAQGRGVLLTGDTLQVTPDGAVSFMWSYPNLLPLSAETVKEIATRLRDVRFDRLYGGWWGRRIESGASAVVAASAERYVAALSGHPPT